MARRSCSGPLPRREFLRAGALALGGLTLPQVLAARAASGNASADTSVILFWMWGGPGQHETFDPKPDAPSEYRGPLGAIRTRVPGLHFAEVWPRLASVADRLSVVRSLHHEMTAHNDGSIEILTGKTPAKIDLTSQAKSEHPDFGMVASHERGTRADGLPQYVGIPRQPFMTQTVYLGAAHAAFAVGDPSAKTYAPPNLTLPAGVNGSRLGDRRGLHASFDRLRRDLDLHGSLRGTDEFRDRALDLLTHPGVIEAFDLSHEPDALRERYGRHLWGQACLLARRLAEAGTSVITVDALAPTLSDKYFSWDDHAGASLDWDMAAAMRYRAPFMDQAVSALIEDLAARGLDRRVMVLALGEFGRTPRVVNYLGYQGRDHWPQAQCALVAGGGLRMGQVVGATNSKGEYPAERPLSPQDLMATVYRHLGIDYDRHFIDFTGRPVPILHSGDPIAELI
ncbi:MAG: DUF1501 domain-containing protein [Pirellulales bacterium]|nr:DUF1501 domain-containing protein [Pirellulales bacterium]